MNDTIGTARDGDDGVRRSVGERPIRPWRHQSLRQGPDLDDAVRGRRCLSKSCPRYYRGPAKRGLLFTVWAWQKAAAGFRSRQGEMALPGSLSTLFYDGAVSLSSPRSNALAVASVRERQPSLPSRLRTCMSTVRRLRKS